MRVLQLKRLIRTLPASFQHRLHFTFRLLAGPVQVITEPREMQQQADRLRSRGRLALVPTMGALHEGHLALIEMAASRAEYTAVSIFVNPTQFGPNEDYEAYPRPFGEDRHTLDALGRVDVLFAPSEEAIYPPGAVTSVRVAELGLHLCGAHRPGHFDGVTTIVSKLFHICRPHVAIFGRKDAQQLVILQQMVRDLFFDIDIIGAPIVREDDGLALSSRNVYLSDEQREQAPVLHRAVTEARRAILKGELRGKATVEWMRKIVDQASEARLQYAQVVDAHSLQPVDHMSPGQEVVAALAVFFGETRLIDNVFVQVPPQH